MANNPHPTLPQWKSFEPKSALAAFRATLAKAKVVINQALETHPHTYDTTLAVVFEARESVNLSWGPISHLNAVLQEAGWRPVYQEGLEEITAFQSEVDQDPRLRLVLLNLLKPEVFQGLSMVRQKVVSDAMRDLKLSGSELGPKEKSRFAECQTRLARLSSDFSNHVLDDTKEFRLWISEGPETEGLPPDLLEMSSHKAQQTAAAERKGTHAITLEAPLFIPFMKTSPRRDLREKLYRAYFKRAGSGDRDNGPLIEEILALRHEQALLLGYPNGAAVSLASKMAGDPQRVMDFINTLQEKGRAKAQADLAELNRFAESHGAEVPLKRWDTSYWSEKLRESLFSLDDQTLRPYFPLGQVLSGLFTIVNRLYGVTIIKNPGELWHPEAALYDVVAEDGHCVAQITMDLLARDGKRSGAWMDDAVGLKILPGITQIPVAHLVCNFPPQSSETPPCLSHDEVTTLFHEMGHVLHHLLTVVNEIPATGIRGVPWDGVELPSQLFESWAWEGEAMPLISKHLQSGDPLPDAMLASLRKSKTFQSGIFLYRQLEFSALDMELHIKPWPSSPTRPREIIESVQKKYALFPVVPEAHMENAFLHIFAGGYAAGYYSYKWAEVLAADAFSYFEENGIFNREAGRHYAAELLSQGGGRDFMQCYLNFRGREPSLDALLKSEGFTPA